MVALPSAPASYAAAVTAALASTAVASGDFSLASGSVSGRRLNVAAKPGVSVTTPGTASHVALLDDSGARILYLTTCPSSTLASGGTVSFAAWGIEISDPA